MIEYILFIIGLIILLLIKDKVDAYKISASLIVLSFLLISYAIYLNVNNEDFTKSFILSIILMILATYLLIEKKIL